MFALAPTLILGSGGREHALAWKLSQSPKISKVLLEPGNPGTQKSGFDRLLQTNVSVSEIADAAEAQGVRLIVIGPEVLLHQGYSDYLRKRGFLVFGPSQAGARLETSKVFAKEFMQRAEVPTAPFTVTKNEAELLALTPQSFPTVLKLDGLAAGKGVVIAKSLYDIQDFAKRIYREEEFGKGPHSVLIEEFIPGVELSYLGLCDGQTFVPLSSSTDHKRVGDGDTGPNTGGMGVVSPSPYFSPMLDNKIQTRIVAPLMKQFQKENLDYRGVLYIGLMIDAKGDPYIIEFNARFGDPETQALMPRLENDLYDLLVATAEGTLAQAEPPRWSQKTCVYVVAAAEGYPGKVTTGDRIEGLASVSGEANLFYSGVALKNDYLVTAGGRVLGIGILGNDVEEARKKAYQALEQVHFRGKHFRKDIGIVKENH